jgi:integrase
MARWGQGSVFKRGNIWWVQYYRHGKAYNESSRSDSQRVAQRLLRQRMGEITSAKFVGPSEERLTFEDIAADLTRDYEINGRRAIVSLPYWLAHLRRYFGTDRAVDITADRVRAYTSERRKAGAANGSINRELTALKRMFSLAVHGGRLGAAPFIKLLEENNVRQGFVEPGDFARLRNALPGYLRDPVAFLYFSAWRKGEMQSLEWRDVDLLGCAVRLRLENSKNGHGRVLKLKGELLDIIARASENRRPDCPFVFHEDGRPIGDFRKAWRNACRAARLIGILIHDLRRSGVRNMIRAGTPERVAMAISGHKTRSMLDRYNIVSEADLDAAIERTGIYVEQHQNPKVTPLPVREVS